MDIVNGLIWGGIGLFVGAIWFFVKNFVKSLKDPDVILASNLGITMSVYKDCQEIYNEWYAWRRDESASKRATEAKYNPQRLPKNFNAFHSYESYMNYLYDIKSWGKEDELYKEICSFRDPYKNPDYEWIRQQKIPIMMELLENPTLLK